MAAGRTGDDVKAKRRAKAMWQSPKPQVSGGGELREFLKNVTPEQWAAIRLQAEKGVRRSYRSTSAIRARKAGALEVDGRIDRFALYDRDKGICHICGGDVPRNAFHLDHVVPLARGGLHVVENLKVAHPMCNLRKGAR